MRFRAMMVGMMALGCMGCSTIRMVDAVGGRGGIDQLLVTQSADDAIKEQLDFTQFEGQKVSVKAVSIGEGADYVREALVERAVKDGAIIVPEGMAEVIIVGKVQSAGTDQYGGSLNLVNLLSSILFRTQMVVGQVKLDVFAYHVGKQSQLIQMPVKKRNSYREFSIFIFGPFKTTTLEDWQ